jgi:pimeloyl-ACP methyl ester carboxylesterase
MRYLCTGLEPDPTGLDSRRAAGGSPAPQPPSLRRRPHDYGVAVMALDLAGQIVPADQVVPLQQGVLVFLEASHLALYDSDKAAREFARARALEVTLHEPAATYLHLVNTRDVEALGARLLPFVAALGDDPALSPEQSPAPHAPVFLLHGADDNVIPAVESQFLARHFEGRVQVRLLLSPLITHAEVNRDASWSDVWQLIAFWASVSQR